MTRAVRFENGIRIIKSLVPEEVTPFQGRIALGESAWALVDSILKNPSTPFELVTAIESATVWRRDSPDITSLGQALGYTDQQIDELFIKASGL